MELDDLDVEKLWAYHYGELPAEQRAPLQQRIATDQAFRAAVAEWELVWVIGFRPTAEEMQLREKYRDRLLRHRATRPPLAEPSDAKRPKRNRGLLLLLFLLFLLLVAYLLYRQLRPAAIAPPADRVLADFGPAATQVPGLIDDTLNLASPTPPEDPVATALRAYEARDYETVWNLLSDTALLNRQPFLRLYAGSAARQTGRPAEAITLLAPLYTADSFYYYREEIAWQLALAYYDDEQPEAALPLLEELVNTSARYRDVALVLLDQITQN